jgi:multiple antibiotic resistance protein
MTLGAAEVFTLFFVTLGPLKVLGPFARSTRDVGESEVRRIAGWVFLFASVALVAEGLLGRTLLEKWRISIPAMTITAGIVFFLVAIRQVLAQYEPAAASTAPAPLPASPIAAANRIVFPTVLTPYGIAAVIALLGASESAGRTWTVLGLALGVLLADLVAMLFARRLLGPITSLVLQLLGSVLAVMQVALSVQLVVSGLRMLIGS